MTLRALIRIGNQEQREGIKIKFSYFIDKHVDLDGYANPQDYDDKDGWSDDSFDDEDGFLTADSLIHSLIEIFDKNGDKREFKQMDSQHGKANQ